MKKFIAIFTLFFGVFLGANSLSQTLLNALNNQTKIDNIAQDGRYTSRDEVAAYLHKFGKLPSNFITKREAQELGWDASRGNLWKVTDKMSIGGDRFGNREGKLPKKAGRRYYECDIDYAGGRRGAKRIVFSNDGLIYYTNDHYNTFTLLYGELK